MMKRIAVFVSAAVMVAGMSGCADMTETQRHTGTGAAVGAVAGAIIGNAAGNNPRTGAVIGAAVGAGVANLWSRNMQAQRAELERATQGTGVSVSQTQDNRIQLNIPSDISFETGSHDIQPGMRRVLDDFAASLNRYPATTVHIVGHTDNVGSDAINNPLSVNRAAATRDYLVSRGVAAHRISIDGRGSREPIATNSTPEGRAMNRRVEIYVAEPAR